MAKILTDIEALEIIQRAVSGEIDDYDQYSKFLEGLGDLIADHFGGERGAVYPPAKNESGWAISFRVNECLPDDGGIFADYDTDVEWKNCVEV